MMFGRPPFKLSALAAASGGSGSGGPSVTGDSTPSVGSGRFRAPIGLADVMRRLETVHHNAAALIAMIRGWILALIARIAQLFGVQVETVGENAAVVASSENPENQQHVLGAAAEATQEINTFVQKLLSEKPDLEVLRSPAGPAYVSTVLGEMGDTIRSLDQQIAENDAVAQANIDALAAPMGVSPKSVRAMLESSSVPEGSRLFTSAEAKAAMDALATAERCRGTLCGLQLSFCTHAIAALRAVPSGAQDEDSELSSISSQLIRKYANADMTATIFRVLGEKNDDNCDLSVVNSAKSNAIEVPGALEEAKSSIEEVVNSEPKAHAAAPMRAGAWRSRIGMSAGVGAEDPPQDTSGAVWERMRQ